MPPVCLNIFLSTHYTSLPHNLIKDKFIDLIERTFNREGSPYLACNVRNAFLLWKILKNIIHGLVKMCDALTFYWTTFFIRFCTKLYRQVV